MRTKSLLETFVVNELANLRTVSATEARLFHFLDRGGAEIDCVVETPPGRVSTLWSA